MTSTHYKARLRTEQAELEGILVAEGRADGVAYAKNAPYRELKLIGKLIDGYSDPSQSDLTPHLLACQACEVDEPDLDTQYWIESNLAKRWREEDAYLQGFTSGVMDILEELEAD